MGLPTDESGNILPGPGRPPGALSKRTLEVKETLDRLGCDPIEIMAKFATNSMPCSYCKQTGRARNGKPCTGCDGTGIRMLSPDSQAKVATDLAPYVAPKLKSMELQVQGNVDVKIDLVARLMQAFVMKLE